MRKLLAFLLILALALLPGCGNRAPTSFTPNGDGTVGRFRWGMTVAQAARVDSRLAEVLPDPEWPDNTIPEGGSWRWDIPDIEFLGHTSSLVFTFQRFPAEGGDAPLRLVRISAFLFLADGEPDYIPLVGEKVSSRMKETAVGCWDSVETLGDRISRSVLTAKYPDRTEEELDTLSLNPLRSVHVLSTDGPADGAGFGHAVTGDREFTYYATGYYQVLAEALERGGGNA